MILPTRDKPYLSIYCTAGYPDFETSIRIFQELLNHDEVDLIEIGMPFSDPIADGPVIQQSNQRALSSGMTMQRYFDLVASLVNRRNIPVIFMGYWNNVFRYGVDQFLENCHTHQISSTILPDLPVSIYLDRYQPKFDKYNLGINCLISPQSTNETIRLADSVSHAFVYQVSSGSTTGNAAGKTNTDAYLNRICEMQLAAVRLIGFGIRTHAHFQHMTSYADGAIIGSAFIEHLSSTQFDIPSIDNFIQSIRDDHTN